MKIVKRHGHTEPYDERKVYASVYAACRVVRLSEEIAEEIAQKIAGEISNWMIEQGEVTSQQILKRAAKRLRQHHEGAALLYETHMDVS